MSTAEVTLPEVLAFRDARRQIQEELLQRGDVSLISFTLNIPGPIKRIRSGDLLFRSVLNEVLQSTGAPQQMRLLSERAGCEAVLSYALPAEELKALCVGIEERNETGRLLDLDVINSAGEKLSRPAERRCIICGGPAAPCARSRTHSVAQLQEKTFSLLADYACCTTAALAVQALLDEVRLTPKPGLVDAANSGAHRDMDLALMERSAASLRPYFLQAVRLGYTGGAECARELQLAGLEAEKTMYAATGGVNTHQGAVFSMGLLCAGAGMFLRGEEGSIRQNAARIAAGLQFISRGSHGEAVLSVPSTGGARGEALSGFPSMQPALDAFSANRSSLAALLAIIAELDDTNLRWRGGEEGLRFLQEQSRKLLSRPDPELPEAVRELDAACISRNLSPGGAADLFAAALFLRSFCSLFDDGPAEL